MHACFSAAILCLYLLNQNFFYILNTQNETIKRHIAQQEKHLNYILKKTDLLESIDQNMPKNNWKLLSDSSPKHTRDRFEKIVTTAFEAAAAEFPETLSHLKGLKLEKVCDLQ